MLYLVSQLLIDVFSHTMDKTNQNVLSHFLKKPGVPAKGALVLTQDTLVTGGTGMEQLWNKVQQYFTAYGQICDLKLRSRVAAARPSFLRVLQLSFWLKIILIDNADGWSNTSLMKKILTKLLAVINTEAETIQLTVICAHFRHKFPDQLNDVPSK